MNTLLNKQFASMSIDNLWTAGGIVSIPLLGFSLGAIAKLAVGIALIIKRIIFWWRVKNKQRRVVKEVLSLYKSDRFAAISKLKQNAQLPIARIFLEAMELEQPTPDELADGHI
jgi:biopolymer transport protein ExbB